MKYGLHRTTQTVSLQPPDDGDTYEIELEIFWNLISKALPARINYNENDSPAEPAEWEIDSIGLEG